jgi:hypothetical protein
MRDIIDFKSVEQMLDNGWFPLWCAYSDNEDEGDYALSKARRELWKKIEHNLTVIVIDERVQFIYPEGQEQKDNSNTPVAWFCYGFGIGKQLIFESRGK